MHQVSGPLRSCGLLLIGLAGLVACGCAPKPVPCTAKKSTKKSPGVRIGALTLYDMPAPDQATWNKLYKYVHARGSAFVDWDAQGKGMLVRTRFGNTLQVHRVSHPLGAREQLTFFADPVRRASWVPSGSNTHLVVQKDRGGHEDYQLFYFDLFAGTSVRLTRRGARAPHFVWSKSGKLAFSSTGENGIDHEIYVGRADAAPKTPVARLKGYWVPVAFAPGEESLLLREFRSRRESSLHLLDLMSHKTTPILQDKKGHYGAAVWDAKGRGLYLVSDTAGEFAQLHHYDLRSKKLTLLSGRHPWNVTDLALSPDGKTLAYVINEKGLSRLFLFDTRRKRDTAIKTPPGIISGLKFSLGRKTQLAFTLVGAAAPADVYAFDPRRGRLTQWTKSEIGGLVKEFFVQPELVSFPTFDDAGGEARKLSAFYYKPPGDGPYPVMIDLHGGPESQYRPRFSALFQYLLLELGVAILAPNVRGSDGYGKSFLALDDHQKREHAVKDVGSLLDWIAGQRELDQARVIVSGISYGGYLVLAALAKYGDRIKAGVDIAGISNLVSFLKNTKPYRRALRRAEYGDERDKKIADYLSAIAPAHQVKQIVSKLFVLHGKNDPRVPLSEAQQLVKSLKQKPWFLVADNEGHGFRRKENIDLVQRYIAQFVRSTLGGSPTTVAPKAGKASDSASPTKKGKSAGSQPK